MNVIGGNVGGTAKAGDLEFIFTHADHSSTAGPPLGFVIKMPTMTLYHAGDTGLFYGMKLIGELYDPDIAFLPIGSLFTMGPKEAVKALQLLECKKVVPMHFKTFPALIQDTKEFKELAGPMVDVCDLKPNVETEITK
jgi:L-ascorbate metabolism protein UlaG (beta-lactamase superfamily)